MGWRLAAWRHGRRVHPGEPVASNGNPAVLAAVIDAAIVAVEGPGQDGWRPIFYRKASDYDLEVRDR